MTDPVQPIIDFFYAIGSRYSYLASTQIPRLEGDYGVQVAWHPIKSAGLIAKWHRNPFDGSEPSGQYRWAYRQSDAEAWAAFYGVPYFEPRGGVGDPMILALACTAAKQLGRVVEYSRALFAALFVEGCAVNRAECIARAKVIGLDPDQFAAMLDEAQTLAVHDATVNEAFRRGAFGVPTFFVGKTMFWGNDRIVLLRHYLNGLGTRHDRHS